MIIVYSSKPQQTDAVTQTPLAHRSHTCMRALALGHDTSCLRNPSDTAMRRLAALGLLPLLISVLHDLMLKQVHALHTCMQNVGHISMPSHLSEGVISH